jgi:hypothetical protein
VDVAYICIYIITDPTTFSATPGGCPSQAVVVDDRCNTQPARLLNGPGPAPPVIDS